VRVWDINYGKTFHSLQSHSDEIVMCTAFQGKVATCSYDSSVKIWDCEKGTLLHTLHGTLLIFTSLHFLQLKFNSI
jgi:WD40 repeat protein